MQRRVCFKIFVLKTKRAKTKTLWDNETRLHKAGLFFSGQTDLQSGQLDSGELTFGRNEFFGGEGEFNESHIIIPPQLKAFCEKLVKTRSASKDNRRIGKYIIYLCQLNASILETRCRISKFF